MLYDWRSQPEVYELADMERHKIMLRCGPCTSKCLGGATFPQLTATIANHLPSRGSRRSC